MEATAGNPLALRELALEAPRLRIDLVQGPLPVETSVERALFRRAGALSAGAARLLALAAAVESGELGTIHAAAAHLSLDIGALEEAESAGLIEIKHAAVEFPHPLLRSAVYHTCQPGRPQINT